MNEQLQNRFEEAYKGLVEIKGPVVAEQELFKILVEELAREFRKEEECVSYCKPIRFL